jgi:hypothetical protein
MIFVLRLTFVALAALLTWRTAKAVRTGTVSYYWGEYSVRTDPTNYWALLSLLIVGLIVTGALAYAVS